jgi:hypothetical protein
MNDNPDNPTLLGLLKLLDWFGQLQRAAKTVSNPAIISMSPVPEIAKSSGTKTGTALSTGTIGFHDCQRPWEPREAAFIEWWHNQNPRPRYELAMTEAINKFGFKVKGFDRMWDMIDKRLRPRPGRPREK